MAEGSIGQVFVEVVPSYADFEQRMRALAKKTQSIFDESVDESARRAKGKLERSLADGNAGEAGAKNGEEFGDGFARAARARTKQAVDDVMDDTKGARKGGAKAGDQYAGAFREALKRGVANAQRELGALKANVDVNDKEALAKIEALNTKFKALANDIRVGVKVDSAGAQASFAALLAEAKKLNEQHPDVEVRSNAGKTVIEMQAVLDEIKRIELAGRAVKIEFKVQQGAFERGVKSAIASALNNLPPVKLTANPTEAETAITKVRAELEALSKKTIGVDIDSGQAVAQLIALQAQIEKLTSGTNDVKIHTDLTAARADIERFIASLKSEDAADIKLDVVNLGATETKIRNGLARALAALPPVRLDVDSKEADAEIGALRERLATLHANIELGVVGGVKATAELDVILEEMKKVDHNRVSIDIHTNALAAAAELEALKRQAESTQSRMSSLSSSLKENGNSFRIFNFGILAVASLMPVLVPLIATSAAGIAGLGSAFASAGAGAGVFALALSGIGPAIQAINAQQKASVTDAQTAAKAQVSAAKQVRTAQESLAKAQQAAQRDEVSSARSITDAQKGIADAREQAAQSAKDSAKQVVSAQRQEADAAQNVGKAQEQAAKDAVTAQEKVATAIRNQARTQQSAARDIAGATRSVETAERAYTSAQKSALDAQNALNDAREQAKRSLEDQNNQLIDNTLAVKQGLLDVQAAAIDLNQVLEDPQATARERQAAQIGYDQQVQSLKELQLQNQRLTTDVGKANQAGVEGSKTVVDAQQNIVDTQQAAADAAQSLADTQVQAAQTVADAQQSVVDAAGDVTKAYADQAQSAIDSADNIAAAQQSLIDATQGVQDAQEQAARSAAQSADAQAQAVQALSDAQAQAAQQREDDAASITQAQQGVNDALENQSEVLNAVSASAAAVAYQMGLLSPAGRDFVNFLIGLKPLFHELRDAAQAGLLPDLQASLQQLINVYGPSLVDFVGRTASALGKLSLAASGALVSKPFSDFFGAISRDIGPFIEALGRITGGLLGGFLQLLTAFEPIGLQFTKFLGDAAQRFSAFIGEFVKSKQFQEFLAYVTDNAPVVGALLASLGKAFLNLLVALAPVGVVIAKALTGFFNFIAGLDPKTLASIVIGLLALVAGVQLAAGAMIIIGTAAQGIIGIIAFFTSDAVLAAIGPALVVIAAALGAVAGGLLAIVAANGGVTGAFTGIISAVKSLADSLGKSLQPAIQSIKDLWSQLGPVLYPLVPVLQFLAQLFGIVLVGAIKFLIDILATVVTLIAGVLEVFIGFLRSGVTGDMSYFTNAMTDLCNNFAASFIKIFTDLWHDAVQLFKDLVDDVIDFANSLYDVLVGHSIIPDLVNAIIGLFAGMATAVYNTVKQWVDDIIGFAYALYGGVWGWVNSLYNDVTKFFTDLASAVYRSVQQLKDDVIGFFKNIYDGVYGFAQSTYNDTKASFADLYNGITGAVGGLPGYFDTLVTNIGTAWDRLKDIAKTPIRFLVDTVLNEGLIGGYNYLVSKFTSDKTKQIDPIKLPDGFAAGGRIPGYSPTATSDNILARVNAGEYIIPRDSTRKLYAKYGSGFMEKLRQGLPGFRNGGLIALGKLFEKEGAKVTENKAFGTGRVGKHAPNSRHYDPNPDNAALDVNTRPGESFLEQAELTPLAAQAAAMGFRIIFMEAGHFDHLHVDTGKGGNLVGQAISKVAGVFGNVASSVGDMLAKPFEALTSAFDDPLAKLEGSPFADVLKAGAGKLLDLAKEKASSLVSSLTDFIGGGAEDNSHGPTGSVKDIVRQVAHGYGWDVGSDWSALQALVNSESSFNPNAQNKSSTAYGLFQFLDSTWGSVGGKKTSDPRQQSALGLKYVKQTYGDPVKAWAFHKSHGWYSDGGPVSERGPRSTRAMAAELHDSGGMVGPGMHLIYNGLSKPEAMLPPGLIDAIMSGKGQGNDGGDHFEYNGDFYSYDPSDIVAAQARHRSDINAVRGLNAIARGVNS